MEKRNKHARVLALHQAPSFKKWRDFRRSSAQKRLRILYALQPFTVSSNILTSLMQSWCIVFMGNQFFRTRLTSKWFPNLLFSAVHKKFRCEERFHGHTLFTYCIFISNALNILAREPLSREGETCCPNSKMPKKFHACSSINKSTERHRRLPYDSPPQLPFYIITKSMRAL